MKYFALLLLAIAVFACGDDDMTDFPGSFSYQTNNGLNIDVQSYGRPAVVRGDSLFLTLEGTSQTLRVDVDGLNTGADLPATFLFGTTNAGGGLSVSHIGVGTVRLSTFTANDQVVGTFLGEVSSPLDPTDSFEISDGQFRLALPE